MYAFNRSAGSDLKVIQQGVRNLLLGRHWYITILLYFRRKHETFLLYMETISKENNRRAERRLCDWCENHPQVESQSAKPLGSWQAAVRMEANTLKATTWNTAEGSLQHTGSDLPDLRRWRRVSSGENKRGEVSFASGKTASMWHDTLKTTCSQQGIYVIFCNSLQQHHSSSCFPEVSTR